MQLKKYEYKRALQINRFITMALIILAGETIFMLPFMIPRLYRPLILEAWGFTNTDLGTAFFAYGLTAMLSYFLGGPFADKYHPRKLISLSLLFTALGSTYLVIWPSRISLIVTYAFFGFSTILLMWGALIKTTHVVGGEKQRSTAMGLLDSGRGLVAALASSLLVSTISYQFSNLEKAQQQLQALHIIYFLVISFTFLLSIAIWINLKNFVVSHKNEKQWELSKAYACFKKPQIWLLSLVVLSSYCGYKSIDNYSIYLVDVHHQNLLNSAKYTAILFWLRPFSAIAAGVLTDKIHRPNGSGRFLILFLLLFFGAMAQLVLAYSGSASFYFVFVIILMSAIFAYALRAIYFSVFGDLKIQSSLIGTTVGIVSFVGFLPDIFFGIVTGRLIDTYSGPLGYQYSFIFTASLLFIGALASYLLYRQFIFAKERALS